MLTLSFSPACAVSVFMFVLSAFEVTKESVGGRTALSLPSLCELLSVNKATAAPMAISIATTAAAGIQFFFLSFSLISSTV